jgi:DNA-binding transcriptional regulator YdaS (Cro superfamily)
MQSLGYEVKSNAQIRQWRHQYAGRGPNDENCTGLELATDGAITREELRPNNWHRIWPEIRGRRQGAESTDDVQSPVGAVRRKKRK